MDKPTLSELEDFTLSTYTKLLKHLMKHYRIIPFCDVRYSATPYLILRHDIDLSLQAALTMAKIEKDLGIRSTYFLLLSSAFYNPFVGENMTIVRKISELGHEIGLHYHPAQYRLYNQSPDKTLRIETTVLESYLGKRIRSISRHGLWDLDPFAKTRRYINANHPYLRADLFVHDSDRAWCTLDGLIALLNNPPERVQLLVHPENWQEDKIDREKLLERHVQAAEKRIQEIKKSRLEYFRSNQLIIDYDNAVKKAESTPPELNRVREQQLKTTWWSLFRYYFIHSKIGWNLLKLKEKIKLTLLGRPKTNRPIEKNRVTGKTGSSKHPLISIIITSHNYGRYLADSIESALNQTYSNLEIIVVDDGSTDNTRTVAALYPVKYVFQDHQGVSVARNKGINLANGEFFVCLDGDDKLVPEYVDTTFEQMLKHPSTGFVYTGSRVWNEITGLENIRMPRRILSKYSLFAGWMGAQGPMLTRRKAFESLNHGYDPSFPAHEDLDLCFRLLTKGWKSDLVYGPLHWYRVHTGSLNPSTPERKRIAGEFMDRKFWFRRLYRKLYSFYQGTVGRVELLMSHPAEYLRGIQKKMQVELRTKSYYYIDFENKEKAQQLKHEIFSTIDMLVRWHRNKALRKYYENRIRIIEFRLEKLMNASKI